MAEKEYYIYGFLCDIKVPHFFCLMDGNCLITCKHELPTPPSRGPGRGPRQATPAMKDRPNSRLLTP